jgi:predicted nucleotidyltransferase
MTRDQVIAKLLMHEQKLRGRGVMHAALFGSVARGDAQPGSDIDIMIEIEPDAPVGLFEYVRIKEYIAGLFEEPVDVVDRDGLKPYIQPAANSDAVYAF